MKRIFVMLLVLGIVVPLQVWAFSESEILGRWEVSSFFSKMVLTVYSFEENGDGVMEIVLNASQDTEEKTFHPFVYEIRDGILFITLVDEVSKSPLIDAKSGKTLTDKYRIVFIEEYEALLQTADRDVLLVRK